MSLPSRLLKPFAAALAGIVVAGLLSLVSPAVAAPPTGLGQEHEPRSTFRLARSSYLCTGYAACAEAGMSHHGYAGAKDTMYWRMYSGHNCTNYAAYMMVRSGLPNTRPWSGAGNATYWGTSMPRITDGVPRVGAVAWWKANTGPAGSAGHVAYVEKVVSADQVIVSQDSWGGDFSWATITRGSGNWPSGFIHFNDRKLVNAKVPVVSGTAKVGSVLTATTGTWKPAASKIRYRWSVDGKAIPSGTTAKLTLTQNRLGKAISVTTTASRLGYADVSATSARTPAVLPGALRNTVAPTITGTPTVDQTLSLGAGTWTPTPRLTYRWLADGAVVPGATGTTLTITPDLVDRVITGRVIAARTGYRSVAAVTTPTAPVAPGTIQVARAPSVSGTARPGHVLTLDHGAYAPDESGLRVAVQWLRSGAPVLNATGPTYRLSRADLGHQITAQVSLSRTGYTPLALTAPRTVPIKSRPRIRLERTRYTHRLRLTMTLAAPLVPVPDGVVVVRTGGFRTELNLRRGVAKVDLKDLSPGWRTVRIGYRGSPTVERVSRTVRVWLSS